MPNQAQLILLAKSRRRRAGVLATGNAMIEKDTPVGAMPPDVRVNRTFEDIGQPDTSGAEGFGAPYVISEMNQQRGREQGVDPTAVHDQPLGEAVAKDGTYGFYDKSGIFRVATHENNVVLQDSQTGKLSVYARTPDMQESPLMGLAKMILTGASAGAPTRIAGGAVAEAARPVEQGAAQTVQAFDRSGVNPSLVTALQNRATSVAANMLRNTPAGGPIERGIRTNIEQGGAAAERLASTLSPVGDIPTAGSSVRNGAGEFIKATVPKKQEELYGTASQLIGSAPPSGVPRTMQVLDDIESKIQDPAIRSFITDPNVSQLTTTIRDASSRGVSFDDLRQLRTDVRSLKPSQDTKVGLNKTSISKIYDALTKDMENMALQGGGQAALDALKKADRFSSLMLGSASDLQTTTAPVRVLRDLVDGRSDEQIFNTLKTWSGKGAAADVKKLELVKRAIPGERWNDFTATYLRNMGSPRPGVTQAADAQEWSPSTFLTSYESMSPRARTLLFSENPTLRASLDDLLTVSSSLKGVQKLGNPSGSGAHVMMGATASGVGTALVTGNVPLLATILGSLGTGNVAARIMMSPKLVRLVTRSAKVAAETRNQPAARADLSWRAHIRSLAAITANDNEISAPLLKLVEAFRQTGQPPIAAAPTTGIQDTATSPTPRVGSGS